MPAFTIGQLGKLANTKVPTIRYYEQVELLEEPTRTAGNQRRYGDSHRRRLLFIRHARELGFSIDAIRELIAMCDQPNKDCGHVDALARRHLADIEARITALESLRSEMRRMVSECAGGTVSSCRVVEVLSDHELCLADCHEVTP